MEKKYIPGMTMKEITGQYGTFFNISVRVEDLKALANEKGYVNITASKRKEVGKYGETHTCVLNEYKPKEVKQVSDERISVEDIPF